MDVDLLSEQPGRFRALDRVERRAECDGTFNVLPPGADVPPGDLDRTGVEESHAPRTPVAVA